MYGANIDGKFSQIVLDASLKYYDENGEDITGMFQSKLNNWIVNNNDFTTVRDIKGNPMANPHFREAPEGEDDRSPEEKEPYLKMPSFDYFFGIVKNPKAPSLINLLALHILHNDEIKFFDELLNH